MAEQESESDYEISEIDYLDAEIERVEAEIDENKTRKYKNAPELSKVKLSSMGNLLVIDQLIILASSLEKPVQIFSQLMLYHCLLVRDIMDTSHNL